MQDTYKNTNNIHNTYLKNNLKYIYIYIYKQYIYIYIQYYSTDILQSSLDFHQ